jgi:hypothetical protein
MSLPDAPPAEGATPSKPVDLVKSAQMLRIIRGHGEHEQRMKDADQKREQRKEYAPRLYWIALGWLGFTGFVLVASGGKLEVGCHVLGLRLSDAVLMTLLGTSMGTVLGLFAIFAKWLYPAKGEVEG